LTHAGTSPDDVPPRVLFTVPDPHRAHAIGELITKLAGTETNGGLVELEVSLVVGAVGQLQGELAAGVLPGFVGLPDVGVLAGGLVVWTACGLRPVPLRDARPISRPTSSEVFRGSYSLRRWP
jgi:hypothetical protein